MNLNQKIVWIHEQFEISHDDIKHDIKSAFPSIMLSVFFTPIVFFGIKMQNQMESRQANAIDYLIYLLIVLIPIALWYLFRTNKKFKLFDCMCYVLHDFLPRKNERQAEIDAFVSVNKIKTTNFTTEEVFDNLSVQPLHEWLRINVSEAKSILKLCHQRAVLKNNKLDMNFLYWTQLVPKVENVDIYKTLLLSSKFNLYHEFQYAAQFTISDVSRAFSNYSETDLFRFFTSPMKMHDYVRALNIFNTEQVPFKVENTLAELFQGLKYQTEAEFKIGPLVAIELEGFVLEQCLTAMELDDLSTYMKNCLMSRKTECQNGTSFIYTLNREGLPYIVFELNKRGRLVEAKKRFNQILSGGETQLVKSIITIMGKKA